MKRIVVASLAMLAAGAAVTGCSGKDTAASPPPATGPKVVALVTANLSGEPADCTLHTGEASGTLTAGKNNIAVANNGKEQVKVALTPVSGPAIELADVPANNSGSKEVDLAAGEYGATCSSGAKTVNATTKLKVG